MRYMFIVLKRTTVNDYFAAFFSISMFFKKGFEDSRGQVKPTNQTNQTLAREISDRNERSGFPQANRTN